jgi:hypothetical protein
MSDGGGWLSREPDISMLMKFVFLIIILLVIVGVVETVTWDSGPLGQAKYVASVDLSKAVVINPKTLRVYGTVQNTGDGAGSPVCMLYANGNANGDFYSTEGVVEHNSLLAPGSVWSFNTGLSLTRQGARITDVYVDRA